MERNTIGKKTKEYLQAVRIPVLNTEKVTFGQRAEGSREMSRENSRGGEST